MAMAEPVRVDKAYTEQDRRLISRRAAAVDGCRHDRAAVRDDERAEKGIPRFVLLRAAAAASARQSYHFRPPRAKWQLAAPNLA